MTDLRLAHTSSLDPATLRSIHALIHEAFDGGFGDEDWEHALGGMHAIVLEGDAVVAHGAVVQRRLLHRGHAFRTGYVEGVAVRADRRRQGHGTAVMTRLADVIDKAYELGALSSGEKAAALYTSLGWRRWEGRTWVLGPNGPERTPGEDDSTYVLALSAELDFVGDLACDWRDGDVW